MTAQSRPAADVVVVGGGVIGLSLAWRLKREGASVVVLERGQVGGQATGAAAGMLAPLAEAKAAGPFVQLGLASLQRYPAFVSALREETGLDPELIGPGMLRVVHTESEEEILAQEFAWQRTIGLPMEWLGSAEARALEPALNPDTRAAVLSVREQNVEPRRLVRALAQACGLRGVRIVENAFVLGFTTMGARVTAVQTVNGPVPCGAVVVAGGAWSESIASWLRVALPVFPVRGQILALTCLPPPIRHTLYTHAGYLVPKADGRVIVGATEDSAGFETRPTAQGLLRLLTLAIELLPALGNAPFESAWAGLRPASADGLPILGILPGWENAHVASGHFRNGILLAPITGELVAQEIRGGPASSLLSAFRPDRFIHTNEREI
ncbi:MAG: thiO [Chthonomonadaceae bacterium]|nr:thiO [Chthonomonadaceae bacterium]